MSTKDMAPQEEADCKLVECDKCDGLCGWGVDYSYALDEYADWMDCPQCEGTGAVEA